MKRMICIMVALLLVVSLVACGGNGDVIAPGNSANGGDSGTKTSAEVTVEPATILDEEGVKIELKELDADGLFGAELKVLIENTTDKDLTVQCRNSSVNGYMVETMFSADVAAGKKTNDSITLYSSDLELSGIETIADIELSFHIFTTEDWETYHDSQIIQIKTSAAEGFVYTYDHPGTEVYNGNGVQIVVKGLSEDSVLGPELLVYIYNTGDKTVLIQTRDTSINGFMVDPIFSEEVLPGKHAVAGVTFMDSDLEENDITKIQELETVFEIINATNWNSIAQTDIVKLSFN